MDYLCFLDESESDAGAQDRFFVFGAALIPIANVGPLHDGIVTIRDSIPPPPDVAFKWNMERIPGVSQQSIESAKAGVPTLAAACGVELFASPVLRAIAVEKKRIGEAYTFGANTIFKAVGEALAERGEKACFLLDRLPLASDKAYDFLGAKMANGVGKPNSSHPLHASVGFGFVDAHSTRIASVLDICLGPFTKCLNDVGSAPWVASGRRVCGLMSHDPSGRVLERGLLARPTKTRGQYHAPYQRMWGRLRALGLLVP
jgi:hypothetical protein